MVRPRHLLLVAGLALIALLLASGYSAYTASATVSASSLNEFESAINVDNFRPPECTMTITSILSGSGTFSATAQFQLVLGSAARDIVTLQKNDCFIGGGPTTGTRDTVTGPAPGATNGDQCIVNALATVTRCTIVATRP
jgi:hypothetical protein